MGPPHPSSILLTASSVVSSIISIFVIVTIAAMLSKFDLMNPNNNKSAATSAIFAKRKGRRKEKSADKHHLDTQHYKATRLVWEDTLLTISSLLCSRSANLTGPPLQPDVLVC